MWTRCLFICNKKQFIIGWIYVRTYILLYFFPFSEKKKKMRKIFLKSKVASNDLENDVTIENAIKKPRNDEQDGLQMYE